jgi:hypothetical protein
MEIHKRVTSRWKSAFKHGHKSGSRESGIHRSWRAAKSRCFNPNDKAFKYYGGRGIIMCSNWADSFVNFLQDMASGWAPGLTLDRVDNKKGYEPGNCRWVSWKDQQNNRRNNRLLTHLGVTHTLTQWAEQLGIPERLLSSRLNGLKWSVEKALTEPKR